MRWAVRSRKSYRRAYFNARESSLVFQVEPDPTFCKAYEIYLDAMADLQNNRIPKGLSKLNLTLALQPHLASALIAYSATLISNNDRVPQAKKMLKAVLQADPSNSLALMNLARLDDLQGLRVEAVRTLYLAKQSILESTEYGYLVPVIDERITDYEQTARVSPKPSHS